MNEAGKRPVLPAGWIGLAGLLLTLAGCGPQEGPHAIHETEIKPRLAGGGMPRDAVHGFASGQAPAAMSGETPEIGFDAPEGWTYEPGTGMRLATFRIRDPGGDKEATLVMLPGTEDGYAANVRRWAGQLGLELSADRIEAFIADREAFSTVEGLPGALFDFTRLPDAPEGGKGSMLAAMIESGGPTLFVKLTGGASFLERNKGKFLALSKSIRMPESETQEAPPSPGEAPMSAAGAPRGGGGRDGDAGPGGGMGPGGGIGGMGGNMAMQSNDPAFSRKPEGVSRLTWQTPPGWKSLEAGGMRTGSFAVTYQGKTADGSIVQLPGPAGGVENNVRRWSEQAGLPPWEDQALRAFLKSQKRIRTRDGFEGILVDLASQLGGNLMQENSILAVLIDARDETIFVKLTGPRTVLQQNLEALAQLSASLAVAD